MNVILIQIGFFCLIPIGIFTLVKGIKMLKKTFNGQIFAQIPITQRETSFQLTGEGTYSLWQEGQRFRKTPLDQFSLTVVNELTGAEVPLSNSIFRPNLNGWDRGRMEMKRFSAEPGSYKLLIREGSSLSPFESAISNMIPLKPVDNDQYFIQVRESSPVYLIFLAIPLLMISGFCIIGGLVMGFLAPQVFL